MMYQVLFPIIRTYNGMSTQRCTLCENLEEVSNNK